MSEAAKKSAEVQNAPSQDQQTSSRKQRKQKARQQSAGQDQNPLQHQGQDGKSKHRIPQPGQPVQEACLSKETPTKTKAQLRAERRALQEAQRAAKAAAKQSTAPPGSIQKKHEQPKEPTKQPETKPAKDAKPVTGSKVSKPDVRVAEEQEIGFFAHLHQYERSISLTRNARKDIHPAILKLGLQYSRGVICGSNARCIALLGALKQVIADYSTPAHKELSRDLDSKIKRNVDFLKQCRSLSVSMMKVVKYLKCHINDTDATKTEWEAKKDLYASIDRYRRNILLAGDAIAEKLIGDEKVTNNDVIMVYAFSSLIKKILCKAHDEGKTFSVIVVDGRPKLEGREMLRRLVKHGITCSYVLINGASYVMREVTKVLLGAHALLANGYVMSRVGSSQLALIARSYNVPVLVCCETYKFSEKVQTDSFVFNELGDPDDLVQVEKKAPYLAGWRENSQLHLLNFVYDVTPSDLISMVITELGMVPCTSVPVVLRIKQE